MPSEDDLDQLREEAEAALLKAIKNSARSVSNSGSALHDAEAYAWINRRGQDHG